jgi:hypothetical protein
MAEEQTIEELKHLCKEQQAIIDDLHTRIANMKFCARCGKDVVEGGAVFITDDVKKEYFKTLLTQKAFKHQYSAFDGGLLITFEMPTKDLLVAQRAALNNDDNMLSVTAITDIMLLSCLTDVTLVDSDVEESTNIYTASTEKRIEYLSDPVASMDEVTKHFDYVVLSSIRESLSLFGKLLQALTDNGLDKNFYEGAGLR